MSMPELFQAAPASAHACWLAEVVDVADPQRLGRVQVKLFNFGGADGHDAAVWARVAVPFAGADRGAFMIPDVGDEVLVGFVNGDFRYPIVLGGLWNGADAPPETLGGAGSRVDRWTIVGKKGTRIAIVEEMDGRAQISLTTPRGGPRVLLDETAGGKIEIEAAGSRIVIDTTGITIDTPGRVQANASQVDVTAGMVNVNAAMSKFSGVVQCDTLISTTVISSAYTPGAGNVW
jgi:uncharacterized protein involved in type VI secretion and phage assembly